MLAGSAAHLCKQSPPLQTYSSVDNGFEKRICPDGRHMITCIHTDEYIFGQARTHQASTTSSNCLILCLIRTHDQRRPKSLFGRLWSWVRIGSRSLLLCRRDTDNKISLQMRLEKSPQLEKHDLKRTSTMRTTVATCIFLVAVTLSSSLQASFASRLYSFSPTSPLTYSLQSMSKTGVCSCASS